MNPIIKYLREVVNEGQISLPVTFYSIDNKKILYREIGFNSIYDYVIISHNYFKLISYLFPSCDVRDTQHINIKGYPDFKLRGKDKEIFLIEVKSGTDSIMKAQIDFALRCKNSYFMFLGEPKGLIYDDSWLEDDKEVSKDGLNNS